MKAQFMTLPLRISLIHPFTQAFKQVSIIQGPAQITPLVLITKSFITKPYACNSVT